MICQRCLRRLTARGTLLRSNATTFPPSRFLSQSASPRAPPAAVTAQTTTATNPRPHGQPAATSASAAQPFSTPLTPAPPSAPEDSLADQAKPQQQAAAAAKMQSSVPAGTVLRGLNFIKNKQDPIALEDHEYPAWLWTVLKDNNKKGDATGNAPGTEAEGDLFSKSKKQRRIAAKALRKQQLLNPESLAPKVPLYEQSIDLPAGNGTVQGAKDAAHARQDLTRAMRERRRSKIKEDNFLRAMR